METADKKSMTQREALKSGRLGGFNAALLKAAESEDVQGLLEAFGQADHINLERLEAVFPDGYAICRRIYNDWPSRRGWLAALAEHFPRLRDLDGPVRFDPDS